MPDRRAFLQTLGSSLTLASSPAVANYAMPSQVSFPPPLRGEDVADYVLRQRGQHDAHLYSQILGAANEFKEGDQFVGVAARDAAARRHARELLQNTKLSRIDQFSPHQDHLFRYIAVTPAPLSQEFTLQQLRKRLLTNDAAAILKMTPHLSSDVIGCVVKLMSNAELIKVGQTVFNPLPGSKIGAQGYMGARIQPNSPTDNVEDILWQVLDGWSYGVGDVLLGTNPVSSTPESVAAIQKTLQEILNTFGIADLLPHCVLSHIDVQAEVEQRWPGSTELWFQSIAGSDDANKTFDISIEKMAAYAAEHKGRFGLYFETGQGADFTNGHGHGFDMLLHESRKYGFARALTRDMARARTATTAPWVHLNDVAGFIGPEVFRTREQLVRCCLEDIVMGKLHGLCIGLDVCSTLHMEVSLDDLNWCLDQIMPANPAYLMALPTKIDPMLGYLTTGFQDHVRIREQFGFRVNDAMWDFFKQLGVIDTQGKPTEHFGDPVWVYLQYCRRGGDLRPRQKILDEGREQLNAVLGRGLFIAEGYGTQPWDLKPALRADIHRVYDDAKLSIHAELSEEFIEQIPGRLRVSTLSENRDDYILHPDTGEQLSKASIDRLEKLRTSQRQQFDVQVVISDGLNALAISQDGHLVPLLRHLRADLASRGYRVAPENLVVTSGRVRAGYRIGECLFGGLPRHRAILHVIGERPGTGHRTFSVYITSPQGNVWGAAGEVDHNITKVVSGIALTALRPDRAAAEVSELLQGMRTPPA